MNFGIFALNMGAYHDHGPKYPLLAAWDM
jgi:hypothetical protein